MLEKLVRVIDAGFRVGVLETDDVDRVLSAFKRLSLSTGRATYAWSRTGGLYRVGSDRAFIPSTRTLAEALGYVAASRHYGVYLFRDVGSELERPSVQRAVTKVMDREDGIRRVVLFLGDDLSIPEPLSGRVARIRHRPGRSDGASGSSAAS